MQMMNKISKKLCDVSTRAHSLPLREIAWEKSLDTAQWFTSPEMISLYGTELYENLDESQRKLLSFYEAINFYSLNINGEVPLVQGLLARLKSFDSDVVRYLHHFIDEENKHMQYFGEFCLRYAGKIYPDKKVSFPKLYAEGEEEFLFFLKVLIFEEIADFHNVKQADDERLHPIARKINALHHRDEARHLIFGREMVKALYEQFAPHWSDKVHADMQDYIKSYIQATWREYYNPQVLVDAQIPGDAYLIIRAVHNSEFGQKRRRQASQKLIDELLAFNILQEVPRL